MKDIPKKYGGISFSYRGLAHGGSHKPLVQDTSEKNIFPIDYDKSTLIIEHFKYNFKFNFDDVSG